MTRRDPVTSDVALAVLERDQGCVGYGRLPGECVGRLELDHVRASHGLGLRSPSTPDNLVSLCSGHHRWKTEHGREARPVLIEYLQQFYPDSVRNEAGYLPGEWPAMRDA